MSQYPLFPEPHWSDIWTKGDAVTSSLTTNRGTVCKVAAGRYVLVRWELPTPHVTRHHSPLGLVKP